MKIFYVRCLCTSSQRLQAKQLLEQGYELRDIRKNPEWRTEAKSYGLKMPFLVNDNGVEKL